MGHLEVPSVTTRLQSCIDANEEKLQNLSVGVKDLTTCVASMKEVLDELPHSIEKMMTTLLKQHGIYTHGDFEGGGSMCDEGSASGLKTPGTVNSNICTALHLDDSTFPVPKVQLPLFGGHDPCGWNTKSVPYFQERDIEEYIEEFKASSALIYDQTEEQSIGMFLRGLRSGVRNWVRILNQASCDQAIEFARHVSIATAPPSERPNRNEAMTSTREFMPNWNGNPKSDRSFQPNSYIKPISQTGPPSSKVQNHTNTSPLLHMTEAEWEERRQ